MAKQNPAETINAKWTDIINQERDEARARGLRILDFAGPEPSPDLTQVLDNVTKCLHLDPKIPEFWWQVFGDAKDVIINLARKIVDNNKRRMEKPTNKKKKADARIQHVLHALDHCKLKIWTDMWADDSELQRALSYRPKRKFKLPAIDAESVVDCNEFHPGYLPEISSKEPKERGMKVQWKQDIKNAKDDAGQLESFTQFREFIQRICAIRTWTFLLLTVGAKQNAEIFDHFTKICHTTAGDADALSKDVYAQYLRFTELPDPICPQSLEQSLPDSNRVRFISPWPYTGQAVSHHHWELVQNLVSILRQEPDLVHKSMMAWLTREEQIKKKFLSSSSTGPTITDVLGVPSTPSETNHIGKHGMDVLATVAPALTHDWPLSRTALHETIASPEAVADATTLQNSIDNCFVPVDHKEKQYLWQYPAGSIKQFRIISDTTQHEIDDLKQRVRDLEGQVEFNKRDMELQMADLRNNAEHEKAMSGRGQTNEQYGFIRALPIVEALNLTDDYSIKPLAQSFRALVIEIKRIRDAVAHGYPPSRREDVYHADASLLHQLKRKSFGGTTPSHQTYRSLIDAGHKLVYNLSIEHALYLKAGIGGSEILPVHIDFQLPDALRLIVIRFMRVSSLIRTSVLHPDAKSWPFCGWVNLTTPSTTIRDEEYYRTEAQRRRANIDNLAQIPANNELYQLQNEVRVLAPYFDHTRAPSGEDQATFKSTAAVRQFFGTVTTRLQRFFDDIKLAIRTRELICVELEAAGTPKTLIQRDQIQEKFEVLSTQGGLRKINLLSADELDLLGGYLRFAAILWHLVRTNGPRPVNVSTTTVGGETGDDAMPMTHNEEEFVYSYNWWSEIRNRAYPYRSAQKNLEDDWPIMQSLEGGGHNSTAPSGYTGSRSALPRR